jgi:hypothetical protein
VGPLGVVAHEPVRRDAADLGERTEEVRVEHFGTIGLIERSMKAFCAGLPGWMKPRVIPRASAHAATILARNSGP